MTDSLKFVKQSDGMAKLFSSLIQKYDDKNLDNTGGFDPKEITQCPRRLIYKTQGIKSDRKISRMAYLTDLSVKEKWVNYINGIGTIRILDKNYPISNCAFGIEGEIDMLLNISGYVVAVQVYPVINSDFIKVSRKGAFKKHIMEMMTYLWMGEEVFAGLLIYENKNNQENVVFAIERYWPIIKSIEKKCRWLMQLKLKGEIPPNPYQTKTSQECKGCEFKTSC